LTAIPGAPLRNPQTGEVIGDSPFMDSLILIITIVFFVAGWCYGKGAGTLKNSDDVIAAITKSWAGLAGLLLLFLLIAQFIAYFNFSHIPDVAAVKLGDVLEHVHIGAVWLLVGVMLISTVSNFIIPQAIAKWALLAPVFIPLFIRLGIAPQTVLAAFRAGDSSTNVITPLNPYLVLVVVFMKHYDRHSGIGTLISVMLPYAIVLTIAWALFFVAWYLIGIPLGPGWPIHL
jgi:aminobenzoyl-glutamate transport protein